MLSSAGIHDVKELPVFLVLSLPLVAIRIVYLVVFLIFSAGVCWAGTLASVCWCCVLCMLPCWSRAVRPLRTCVHMGSVVVGLHKADSKSVQSFCLKNTCLNYVKEENYQSYTSACGAEVKYHLWLMMLCDTEESFNDTVLLTLFLLV